ncbi:hypothetical protein K493DRAFT_354266 [Basidiobolus meristosporus CBS 931.73]|uniref:RNI-like protein n=1 Tax=Basidiobolus meristosporus CBS 931.73 TaxID=1314790 RepID=A0A1Y1Y3M0_9FUNG|nr:hypothetical protein K493DRAFT_354266 [Basidiobolus meristosporus CBS 931.73]|eukprot:ORX92621.1 hypothetical protein K493DRAFT_354266 [Basidiobolus meristosporus CBS 931.73]
MAQKGSFHAVSKLSERSPEGLLRFEKLLKVLLEQIEAVDQKQSKRKRTISQRLTPSPLLNGATRIVRKLSCHLTSCITNPHFVNPKTISGYESPCPVLSRSLLRKEQNYPELLRDVDLRWLHKGLQRINHANFYPNKMLPEICIEKLLHRFWVPFCDKYSSTLEKLHVGMTIPLDRIFPLNSQYTMLSYLDLKIADFDMEHATIISRSCRQLERIRISTCISIFDLGLAKVLACQQSNSFKELILECPEPLSISNTINTLLQFHRQSLTTLKLNFYLFPLPGTRKNNASIGALSRFENLRCLELRGCPSANDERMEKVVEVCSLTKVVLERTSITHVTIEALAKHSGPQLKELSFGTSDKRLGHVIPMLATHCPNIRVLESTHPFVEAMKNSFMPNVYHQIDRFKDPPTTTYPKRTQSSFFVVSLNVNRGDPPFREKITS